MSHHSSRPDVDDFFAKAHPPVGGQLPVCITQDLSRFVRIAKAPQLIPTILETSATTKALLKNATDQRELTSTFENNVNKRVIVPTHSSKSITFVVVIKMID